MISFIATLKRGKSAVSVDAQDGEAEIRLLTSGTELAHVMKLMCMKGRAFKVMIFEIGEKNLPVSAEED